MASIKKWHTLNTAIQYYLNILCFPPKKTKGTEFMHAKRIRRASRQRLYVSHLVLAPATRQPQTGRQPLALAPPPISAAAMRRRPALERGQRLPTQVLFGRRGGGPVPRRYHASGAQQQAATARTGHWRSGRPASPAAAAPALMTLLACFQHMHRQTDDEMSQPSISMARRQTITIYSACPVLRWWETETRGLPS